MWETPIYRFEEETANKKGEIIKKPILVNVTYSAPRNLFDPGKALKGVFKKITKGLKPEETHILDVGAGKLRNTLWLLEKGFHVWCVEFPELKERLLDAKNKWELAKRKYPNFHHVTFPKDFFKLNRKFDIILLVNVINVMPIPIERFALLALCKERIKNKGMLLWHQWRAYAISPEKYTEENALIDGHIMGSKNHTFYCEHTREETHEMLYALGFTFNKEMNLNKVPANSCYSYIYNSTHNSIIPNALNLNDLMAIKADSKKILEDVPCITILDLYVEELKRTKPGREDAHKYHILASRILFDIFRPWLKDPVIEREIDEGRGRIDFTMKNKNKEGVFKNARDLRDIKCPIVIVEAKNYKNDLTTNEYAQIGDRLMPQRGMLGFLLCRDNVDKKKVIAHCRSRQRGGNNKYIIVLDDDNLITLANFRRNEDEEAINEFIEEKIEEIID